MAQRMSRQRRTGTDPEMAIRRLLHRAGLRYRVDAPLPGLPRRRADLLFTSIRLAVFIDGCFWHACPIHATAPKSNADWWRAKLTANVARDRDTDRQMNEMDWLVLRFWEHQDPVGVVATVATAVRERRAPTS